MAIPTIRTISKCAEWLKENDADTSLTTCAIRRLVTSGTISSVRVGNRYLVNIEVLEEYLRAGTPCPKVDSGSIRPVDARR